MDVGEGGDRRLKVRPNAEPRRAVGIGDDPRRCRRSVRQRSRLSSPSGCVAEGEQLLNVLQRRGAQVQVWIDAARGASAMMPLSRRSGATSTQVNGVTPKITWRCCGCWRNPPQAAVHPSRSRRRGLHAVLGNVDPGRFGQGDGAPPSCRAAAPVRPPPWWRPNANASPTTCLAEVRRLKRNASHPRLATRRRRRTTSRCRPRSTASARRRRPVDR